MAEYIEREAAVTVPLLPKEHREYQTFNLDDAYEQGWYDALDNLVNIPAADVAQVRHGRWIMKHKHRGGFRRYTGIDDMGEQHTITVDERVEYDDRYCSECGKQSADNFLNYCPNCGAKMDLEN